MQQKIVTIEVPCFFTKENQPDFEELGMQDVEVEKEIDQVTFTVNDITGFYPSSDGETTWVERYPTSLRVDMTYDAFKKLYLEKLKELNGENSVGLLGLLVVFVLYQNVFAPLFQHSNHLPPFI